MNPSWPEVNAAVLAVLGDFLGGRKASSRPAPSRNGHHAAGTNGKADGFVFADRLLSLRHAETLANGSAREIRVAPGTVVTPLARDWLKRQGLVLRIVSGKDAAAARARAVGEWGFAIESRSGQAESLRRSLLEGDAWSEVGADATEAAHWVVDGEGRGVLVVADEASVACWRANRVEGIRAASVAEVDAVARAIRHLGANLLVVEPAGTSIYLLKHLGERFRRGGAPALPDGWDDDGPEIGTGGTR
ncbi:hypothetical protein TA3x_004847 [Tundrisphaera sp. TA3]|uniref:hypothetical protein n=1 Tax=Tundrisphaera sp. TA3 TaxID=3435775 RepID=UPI003EBB8FA2